METWVFETMAYDAPGKSLNNGDTPLTLLVRVHAAGFERGWQRSTEVLEAYGYYPWKSSGHFGFATKGVFPCSPEQYAQREECVITASEFHAMRG